MTEGDQHEQYVTIKACQDVRIYLSKYLNNYDINSYEIRLGGEDNTRALIFRWGEQVMTSRLT